MPAGQVLLHFGWVSLLWLAPGPVFATPLAYEVTTADGKLRAELPGVVDRGVPYFSLERVATVFGGQVTIAPGGKSATLRVAKQLLQLSAGRPAVISEGRTLALEKPPKLISGVFMVPAEFLSKTVARVLGRSVTVAPVSNPRPALVDLRFRSYPTYTRVVVEGSSSFEYTVAEAGRELQVILPNLRSDPNTYRLNDSLIQRLELEPARDRGTLLRITFAGSAPGRTVLTLRDPPRLVLDFTRPSPPRLPATAPQARPLKLIVLDPGHGGHDPGATGAGGLQEKEVVLDVTKRLARILEAEGGVRISLSRTGDYFVPLKERTSFANGQRADLFVSIHANAHRVSASEGVETYFLSSEATDNEARAVAAFENGVIALEPHKPKEDILKSILWDMAQSQFQEESSHLAEILQDSLAQSLNLQNRGVKQAAFYVLGGAAMPAVLVEVGFVTNPREERRLMDEAHRERVARALAAGLMNYKRRYDQRMGAVRNNPSEIR